MPSDHADAQARQQLLNRNNAEPLLEKQIAHPQREHRAETVADKLEGFEKGHGKSNRAGLLNCFRRAGPLWIDVLRQERASHRCKIVYCTTCFKLFKRLRAIKNNDSYGLTFSIYDRCGYKVPQLL